MFSVLVVVGMFLVGSQTMESSCSSQVSSAHVNVDTLRSDNGNWVTKVRFERGGGRGQMVAMKTEPWSVAVDLDTKTCVGAESKLQATLTMTAPLFKMGNGFDFFPGIGYYRFYTNATTWSLAHQTCAAAGAHLLILNSEAEADVAKKLFAKHPSITGADNMEHAWVGVLRKNGAYITIFGDIIDSTGFTRWNSGEPDKGKMDDCIMVSRASGGLADIHCQWKVAFICEHEL